VKRVCLLGAAVLDCAVLLKRPPVDTAVLEKGLAMSGVAVGVSTNPDFNVKFVLQKPYSF
jgi:hypothetical protein